MLTPANAELTPGHYAARRARLIAEVEGPVLLVGNGFRARNLPMTQVPFRQDSTFLFYTGCTEPDAAVLLTNTGETLFLEPPAADDALWHGRSVGIEARAAALGFNAVRPSRDLDEIAKPGVRALAVPDAAKTSWLATRLGTPLAFGHQHGDPALVQAVIAHRRVKSAAEMTHHRQAAAHTAIAFEAAIGHTRAGYTERQIAAVFHGALAARGCTTGYDTILTQHGEVLHQHAHEGTLTDGKLLLLDGGGEVSTGHGVDITRTWPVSATFTPRQRGAYDAVLAANLAGIAACTPGRPYQEVHHAACAVLAQFLLDEGLVNGTVDSVVATGAHAIFFPHGVGHLLGLDVHDLENFGDLPAYPQGRARSEQFGLSYLRLTLPLEVGNFVTIEPGFYIVPAILSDASLRDRLRHEVRFDRAEAWLGFGGIRIEDDVLVTDASPEVITSAVPKTADAIEAAVGSAGPLPRWLL